MIATESKPLTLDDFLILPEFCPSLNYYGGRIVQKMSPRWDHGIIQYHLGLYLGAFVLPRRLGEIVPELRCTFGGASYVPDLTFWVRDRIPDRAARDAVGGIPAPPDLAVEILSPGQTVAELAGKLRSAARGGVRLGWLVDDRKRQVHVLRPGVRARVLRVGEVLDGGEVLPGFALPLAELFGWLDGD